MFTGLIQQVGTVVHVVPKDEGGVYFTIRVPERWSDLNLGESVAVNGVCLTVLSVNGEVAPLLTFELMVETLKRTTFLNMREGSRVNVERALSVGDRLGGHLLTGHVDDVATIVDKKSVQGATLFTFRTSKERISEMIPQGSVAIDGISLTVVDIFENDFTVSILPYTLTHTNLIERKIGDGVHLETDMFGKLIKRYMQTYLNR